MASGKKERIIISCVTFDVAKVVEPAVHYEGTRIHLIHYGDGVYREFYEEVCRRLKEELPKIDIIDEDYEVFDFNTMLNRVFTIITEEQSEGQDVDIFVNVSAGTSEYSAAALIASMMAKDVIPFNVPTSEHQVPADKIREIYYENDRPIGLAKKCKDPERISTYNVQKPDVRQVLALGVLKDRLDAGSSITAASMIPILAEQKLMTMTCEKGTVKPDQKTIMNYQRNFVDRWMDNEWTERMSRRSMRLTPEGRMVLDVFLDGYREIQKNGPLY